MIRPNLLESNYSIKFPYESFSWRLEYTNTICYFQCEEHLQKHIDRYKLKNIIVENRDGKSLVSSQKHKNNLQQVSGTKSKGSSGTIRERKSSMDSTGNTPRNTRKKK